MIIVPSYFMLVFVYTDLFYCLGQYVFTLNYENVSVMLWLLRYILIVPLWYPFLLMFVRTYITTNILEIPIIYLYVLICSICYAYYMSNVHVDNSYLIEFTVALAFTIPALYLGYLLSRAYKIFKVHLFFSFCLLTLYLFNILGTIIFIHQQFYHRSFLIFDYSTSQLLVMDVFGPIFVNLCGLYAVYHLKVTWRKTIGTGGRFVA
jgi:hypothetical protein